MKKLLLLGAGLFFAGCVNQTTKSVKNQPSPAQPTVSVTTVSSGQKTYSLTEVAKHNTANDCWITIEDKVYDVSSFTQLHPGKEAILQGCGQDATELYNTRPMGSKTPHSEKAREKLKEFYIGKLAD